MKPFLFSILLISTTANAQFNQIWQTDHDYFTGSPTKTFMRIADNDLYVHPQNIHSAQSVTLGGVENWFMSHNQFGACADCFEAAAEAVAIASNGDAYGVGTQSAAPYDGRYIYKVNSLGELQYAEEYFTSTFASEFNDVKLSADESMLYVFGLKYASEYATIAPYLFKVDPTNGNIVDEAVAGIFAWAFPKRMVLDNDDNIYLNGSNVAMLRFTSFDSNLDLRWTDSLAIPEFIGNGEMPTQLYSNGDALFSSILQNFTDVFNQRLFLTRYTPEGTQIWQQTVDLSEFGIAIRKFKDMVLDANGNVYFYFEQGVGELSGPTAPEVEQGGDIRGGKGNQFNIRPEVFSFDPNGQLRYHFVYPGMSSDIYFENPNQIIVDENGYLIGSSDGSEPYTGISYFLVSPTGNLESEIRLPQTDQAFNAGLIYAGNKVFYAHSIGENSDLLNGTKWSVARYTYDYITGFQVQAEMPFTVYPNPSLSGSIQVSGIHTDEPLSIFSADGKLIWSLAIVNSQVEQINTADFSPGIYVLKNGSQQLRFVITQ
jgi:hypothetical protein